ncbi:MAG TPA: DUF2630 family protein [Burkholderiales bacterium]|nr:DUF2630 family protein [Burkholderiales bacterium]
MADTSYEQQALDHITRLTQEEHRLYNQLELSEDERKRLRQIEIELDQCWDLLRQRRAKREFGDDPAEAQVRPPEIVEKYEQ